MDRMLQQVKRRKRLAMIALVIAILAAALGAFLAARAPAVSSVQIAACIPTSGGVCARFPIVSGANLNGATLTLPADFAGDYNLVVVSFDEGQTARAADWLPLAQAFAAQRGDFAYYSVPVMKAVNPLMRGVIVGGMVVMIPDDGLRERTIMLFLDDQQAFLDALAIPDLDAIQVLLLNNQGEVLWRASGDYSETMGDALRKEMRNRS